MNAVAVTDHGNMFGAISFTEAMKNAGVRPILGCEVYVIPPGQSLDSKEKDIFGRIYYHLVLLAKDYEGYINLCKLSSIAYIKGFYYRPRIDFETLAAHSKGLIALSACIAGCLPKAIIHDDLARAKEWADMHIQIFGKDNYYFEIENHDIPDEHKVIKGLTALSKEMNIPLVATNDAHYMHREDATFHDIMLCIQTGKLVSDDRRLKFYNDSFYIKSAEEMIALFPEHPEAIKNTLVIADKCMGAIKFSKDYKAEGINLLPVFTPEHGYTDIEYLRKLTAEGLKLRYEKVTKEISDRCEYELDVIEKMGFASYFLVVWDFINYAKSNDIPVGPGRGSAAGSIVSYALKITDIDPLEHSLIFERFLNPERVSMPDIDVDFCFENRYRVIDYVRNKYGVNNVGQICTMGTLQAKNAVADVGRAMGISLDVVNKLKKLVNFKPDKKAGKTGIEMAFENAKTGAADNAELLSMAADPEIHKLLKIASDLEDMPRNTSTHAAGVVIAGIPLAEVVPLYKQPNKDDIAVQYDMIEVEKLGLLKMDFLGLKNLTVIENTLKSIKKETGTELNWDKIGYKDEATYKLLQEGKTLGVFQLESPGMTKLVIELAPSAFSDLTALLALFRPGPLGSGMHTEYVLCKHGRKKPFYDHPELEPILKETYGNILYQEQVMQIVQILGGFTLGQADNLRRAMGKKNMAEMMKGKKRFVEGCIEKGINKSLGSTIYDKIEKFADYGFNKSHSAAYAVISYRTAYLKAHYTTHYLAALMSNAIGGKVEDMTPIFAEANSFGIPVLPPNINLSDKHFTVHGKAIRFGLAAIKTVGEAVVENIINCRNKDGDFKSIEDFCYRIDRSIINARIMEALIKVGAFDSFVKNRAQLLAISASIIQDATLRQQDAEQGQESLFGDEIETVESYHSTEIKDWPLQVKLGFEKEYLGYYVSGKPNEYEFILLNAFLSTRYQEFERAMIDSMILIGGILSDIKVITTRNHDQMAFAKLLDQEENAIPVTFFPRLFEPNRNKIVDGAFVVVSGTVKIRNDQRQLNIDEIFELEQYIKDKQKILLIEFETLTNLENTLIKLENVLRSSPGNSRVQYIVSTQPQWTFNIDFNLKMAVEINNSLIQELKLIPNVKTISIKAL